MKKWLIIVVSFAVTLALLLCLTPVLRVEKMKMVYIEQFCKNYEVQPHELEIELYGTYSGCTVAYIHGPFGYLAWIEYERVGNYTFTYSSSQKLKAYKDGNYLSLKDAYDAGWLDNDDVKKIHELHKQNFPICYQ